MLKNEKLKTFHVETQLKLKSVVETVPGIHVWMEAKAPKEEEAIALSALNHANRGHS